MSIGKHLNRVFSGSKSKSPKTGEVRGQQLVSAEFFPTQTTEAAVGIAQTIGSKEREFGAPFGPLPSEFYRIPRALQICNKPVDASEMQDAMSIRKPFAISNYPDPHMDDIIRAFRLIKGAKAYLEIGIFDRGNLAFVSTLLSDKATLIGVDTQIDKERDELLASTIGAKKRYCPIIGDSRDPKVVHDVGKSLDGQKLDAVFIDGDHTAYGVMSDYVNYRKFVKDGGYVFFHDSLWEGDNKYKGSAAALAEIDRFNPIYLVPAMGPCYRFSPLMFRDPVWGVVGICKVGH